VNPDVGKIGTQSPTYIQPVAERSDGIKSFFQKQQPSPARTKAAKGDVSDSSKLHEVKKEKKEEIPDRSKEEIKEEAEGIKAEAGDGDVEEGMGDDSNAPNPSATKDEKPYLRQGEKTPVKRKRQDEVEEEEEGEKGKVPVKKGGHQTKIVRRAEPEEKTDVSCYH